MSIGVLRRIGAAMVSALLLAGCGGGGSGSSSAASYSAPATPTPSGPTTTDLSTVATALVQGMIAPSNSAVPASAFKLPKSLGVTGGCSAGGSLTTSVCNIQISGTDSTGCTSGYNNYSGSIYGTINTTGSSTLNYQMTVTPHCTYGLVSTGGDPYLSMIATMTVSSSGQASFNGTGPSGGFYLSENGIQTNCLVLSPATITATGAHGSMSGANWTCNGNAFSTVPASW